MKRNLLKAGAASFLVYALPLAGPHAAWLLGETIFFSKNAWEVTANLAAAIVLQIAAAILFYWCFSGGRWRWIAAVVTLPAFWIVAEWLYMAAIPAHFLVEKDTSTEKMPWREACTVSGYSLIAAGRPGSPLWTEAWTQAVTPPYQYAIVTMPGCQVQKVEGAQLPMSLDLALPGGRALFQRTDPPNGTITWWFLDHPGAALERLEGPAVSSPVFSNDGQQFAWIEQNQAVIKPRSGKPEPSVHLGTGSFVLLGLDSDRQELAVWNESSDPELRVIGFDGEVRKTMKPPAGLRPQSTTYLYSGSSWLAWDAYQEDEPYRVAWSLAGGSGTHRLLKGRSVTSAAFDPDGRFVALSETRTVSVGSAADAVTVLDAATGAEVLRKRLPDYSRSPVVFLQGGFFLFNDVRRIVAVSY